MRVLAESFVDGAEDAPGGVGEAGVDEYPGAVGGVGVADEVGVDHEEPQAGDVIVANNRKYEVMDLGGESCWRWSDPYRMTLRIHTKDIGEENV